MNDYTRNGISPETLQAWGSKAVDFAKEQPVTTAKPVWQMDPSIAQLHYQPTTAKKA